jgi:hypothetical protein
MSSSENDSEAEVGASGEEEESLGLLENKESSKVGLRPSIVTHFLCVGIRLGAGLNNLPPVQGLYTISIIFSRPLGTWGWWRY